MDEIIEKEIIDIENMIYEIRGVQVMLDRKIIINKYCNYIYDKIITRHDIDKLISMLIYFADTSAKLGRN